MAERRASNNIVAAIVIEPTQQTTGYVASDEFMNALRSIADDFEAALIVDETSTGCGASGKGFWQSNVKADYVVFGKRTQATGYFHAEGLGLGGSENDVKLLKIIHQGIQQDNLINRVSEVGAKLASDAQNLKLKARTSGTSMWIETESPAALVSHMRS